MGERVVLDVARRVAERLELGQRRRPPSARLSMKAGADVAERLLQMRVGERVPGVLLEARRGDVHGALSRRSPIGGVVGHAGEHLGDVPRLDRRCPGAAACRPCSSGSRDRRRAACRRRWPRSPRSSSSTMALEMSGYLTQNVPPKPQQTSASGSSSSFSPATESSSRRGCALDAELAQARAGVVVGDACRRSAASTAVMPQHVDEEADQLEGLARRSASARGFQRGVAGETGRDSAS